MTKSTSRPRMLLRLAVFSATLLALGTSTFAAEPAERFLEALKEKQYFDTAIEYLDMAKDDPLVPPTFKVTIPYEKALTLILSSRTTRDTKAREKQLDEAGQLLEQFVTTQKAHPYAALASSQRANLLVERAKINVERSKGKNVTEQQKSTYISDANKFYDEAISIFQSAIEDLRERLKRFTQLDPNNPSHKRLIEIRDRYRTDFLQARILIPAIREEKAETFPEDSEQRKTLLTDAAKEYKDVHEDYRTRIAGLYAQLYEGRCYAKLKNEKEALFCFNELLNQPDGPEFRELKLKTLVNAAPVWLESDPPKVDEAIDQINKLMATANQQEEREPDWLFLRLSLAQAHYIKSESLKEQGLRTKAQREARTAAQFVARYNSEHREAARELLTKLPGGDVVEEETGPLNFEIAHTKGKEALSDMNTADGTRKQLVQEYRQTTDEDRKAELAENIKTLQDEIESHALRADDLLRKALSLAEPETKTEDMNIVRYLLCYLYFYQGDYYDAATMGEFVATRYPSSSVARQCAKIAMASYIKARKDAVDAANASQRTAEVKFESDKITEICEFITKQWKNEPEAAEAANTLIVFSLQDNDFQKAADYLELMPESSPQRAYSERLIGQHAWSVYLNTIRQLERGGASEDVLQGKKKEFADIVSNAAGLMESGLGWPGSWPDAQPVTQPVAAAALSLAQIYVDRGETDKALALLEDSKIGPLSLVKQKHQAATEKAGFDIETYKTALRANIAALSSSDPAKREAANAKAEELINSLTAAMGSTPEGEAQLVGTFIAMASNLKDQMDGLSDSVEKKAFAQGLARFLDQVNNKSDKLTVRTWVADTFSKLGETFANDPQTANPYYRKSVEAFSAVLKDPELNADTQLQIEMRLGDTKLLLGEYPEALEEYVKVLKKKSSMLNVQVKAAMALQQWGDASAAKTPKTAKEKYTKAMVGDFPGEDKKNIVWGWGKLFQITMRYEQFRNTFYEARYNLAYCRYRFALLQDSDDNRKKYLRMAKNDILSTMKVAKDLGGETWQPKFNALMIDIQRALGETPKGLDLASN